MTAQVTSSVSTAGDTDTWVVIDSSAKVIDTHLLVILTNLTSGVTVNATSQTTGAALPGGASSGEPYYRLFLPGGVLPTGQSVSVTVTRTGGGSSPPYALNLLSGQGNP